MIGANVWEDRRTLMMSSTSTLTDRSGVRKIMPIVATVSSSGALQDGDDLLKSVSMWPARMPAFSFSDPTFAFDT